MKTCEVTLIIVCFATPTLNNPGLKADEMSAATLVKKVRHATGISEFERQSLCVKAEGESQSLGLKGRHTLIIDSTGRFIRTNESDIPTATLFDGEKVRSRDIAGEVTDQILGDRLEALFEARAMTGMWFSREFSAQFQRDLKADTEKSYALSLEVDDGRATVRVLIDRATFLPRRWKLDLATNDSRIDLEGVRQAGPLKLPAKVKSQSEATEASPYELSYAEPTTAPDWAALRAAMTQPNDSMFATGIPPRVECKRTTSGHLLVRPRVNDKEIGWFIFDTGAGQNILDKRAIKQTGIKTFGEVTAIGVGGSTKVPFCRPESLQLGPVTLRSPLLSVFDLAFLDMPLGEKIAGIIGYGLLARCVVELDQAVGDIRIHNPADYKLIDAEWTPLSLYHRVACVPGTFEGHDGMFRLDTGAGGWPATFHGPTTRKYKLLDARKTKRTMVGGVGGMKSAKSGVIKSLAFGGQSFEKLTVAFATVKDGAFADPYIDANIGENLIGRSVIIMDYANGRIVFRAKPRKK